MFASFSFILAIFLIGNVSAGSNGDAPQEGQDWIINQDTHVWDSDVNVKDIVLTFGKTLKLENVTLSSVGDIELLGNSQWINSSISHEQSTAGDNISIYSNLVIINTELVMSSLQKNSELSSNCIYLAEGSVLHIRDFDLDASTTNDRSKISSDLTGKGDYNDKWNYTSSIGVIGDFSDNTGITNTKVMIENSDFRRIQTIIFTGAGSYVKNSTFDETGIINAVLDNFIFSNNSLENSVTRNSLPFELGHVGDHSIFEDNIFENGTGGLAILGNFTIVNNNTFKNYDNRGGESTLLLFNSTTNTTVSNNLFQNLSRIHSIYLQTSDDNLIKNNSFISAGGFWHTIIDRSGYRNIYSDNYFEDCDRNNNSVPWYQTCIVFFYWTYPTDYRGGEHLVENNTFNGYKSAVRFNSYQDNNTIINNKLDRGAHGIGLWTWPQGTTSPSGNLISNNTINNTYYPIALDYFNWGDVGIDNNITFNYITNTGGRAITVWSTYANFTISNNYIYNSTIGIWVYDDAYGGIANGYIYDNELVQIKYNGIQVAASWGSTFAIDNIHINNNHIDTEGNGIYARDVDNGYFANNTISGNLSHGSQGAGIVGYSSPELIIINNTISSAIGVEVGGISDASLITVIESNEISVSAIGVLSNRTFTKVIDNYITGSCSHEKCPILYLQDVASTGIFSQEGNIVIEENRITKFKESVTILLADFVIEDNNIDFSEFGITANNSEGDILSNIFTNNSKALSSSISIIDIRGNDFSDFEKAVYAFNSTILIEDNFFSDGDFCIDLIDSDYELITNDYNCRDMDYQVRYNIQIHISNENGKGSEDHLFEIFDAEDNLVVDSLTDEEGFSSYFQLDIIRKLAGNDIALFNPFKIIYENNNVPVVVYKNISFNHTIDLLLDTQPPTTILVSGEPLINQQTINLEIMLLDDNNDVKDYTIEYLVNDEFAEWETYGTFEETSITFDGVDGREYRFRSLGRDIYGNIESKDIYEDQVKIDITTPETEFLGFSSDYYFIGSGNLDLNWFSNDGDISAQTIEVYYTNFSTPYLNPNSVTWFLIDNIDVTNLETYNYEFNEVGHYSFKIISEDLAENIEQKSKFDVIFNYDSESDTLNFGDIPKRWGEHSITIEYSTSSFNLDFDIYLSLEDIAIHQTI